MRRIALLLVLLGSLAAPAAAQAAQPAAGAASYAVYRGTAKNAITTRVIPPGGVLTTSHTDTTAVNGTAYYYAVRAVIGGIESADSNPVQATPAARTCSAGSPVVLENCLPGNPNWRVLNAGDASAGGIEGFATQQSINKGESVGLKVRSSGPYDVQVFRMGYYGGAGARLVSSMRDLPASTQPACNSDATTGLVDCANWAQSTSLSTTSGWTSGMYLLRIVRTDNNADFHILVAVRDDGRRSEVLFGAAFTAYQAYNQYGGKSLYDFNSIGANTAAGTPRAVKVSFDRPFEQPRTRQRDWYVEVDQPFVAWLEQEGYDVNYASDADLERFPSIARNAGAYFSPAHDEYWSGGMRTALEQARDAGTNLFFAGANEGYWKIRLENSPTTGATGRTQ